MGELVQRYLDSFPRGIAAYPGCVEKASVCREFFHGYHQLPADVPAPVRELVEHPPPASTWVPEVVATAAYLAVREAYFSSDEAFVDFAYERNRELLRSPLYRVVMFVASPQRVIESASKRWGVFHQGSRLETTKSGDRRVQVRLYAPAGVFPELLLRCQGTAFRAVLEGSGGKDVDVTLSGLESNQTSYDARWSR